MSLFDNQKNSSKSQPDDDDDEDDNSVGFFKPKQHQNRERSREKSLERKKNSNQNSHQSRPYQRPFKRDLCKYFLNGVCTKGDKCTYSHIINDFPCKYFITLGNCDNKECR